MTFSGMGESEMAPESNNSEAQETVESPEVVEEAAQLEQVTFETEETIATTGSYQEAEVVETGFAEVMQAAVTELPEPVTEKGDDPGDGPKPPYDPRDSVPSDNRGGGPSGDGGDVLIDTVPLPESPMEIGEREMIGTWPTPEEPSVMEQAVPSDIVDRVAIIDTNDGPSTIDKMEKVDQVSIIDTNDGPRVADRAGSVSIIDTNDRPHTIDKMEKVDQVTIIDSNDGPNVKERVGPPVTDDSNIPPPSPDSSNMEIPEGMRDGPPGSSDSGLEIQAEQELPGAEAALPQEGANVPETIGIAREGSGDELRLVRDGDDDDTFDPGVDQFFDPHRDGLRDGSLGRDGMKDVNRGEDVGLQDAGRAADLMPDAGADMNIGDALGGVPAGLGENPLGFPGIGDPRDIGVPGVGADPRISNAGPGPGLHGPAGPALLEFEHQVLLGTLGVENSSAVAAAGAAAIKEEAGKYGKTEYAEVMDDIGDQTGGDPESESDPAPEPAPEPEPDPESTPDPEGGDDSTPYREKYYHEPTPPTKQYEVPEIKVAARQPLDYGKSMMQPVGEDGYGEGKPRPLNLKEALNASLDPNINWGDDSSGGLSSGGVVDAGDFDPDGNLVDPPDGISGEGGGKNPPK